MLTIHERIDEQLPAALTLTLPFDMRCKSRLRATLDNGEEVGLVLPRGTVLREGDRLRTVDGKVVEVRAACEHVSTAVAQNVLELARACYHLGNRHVSLQIGSNCLRYLHDHVLDQLVMDLGLMLLHEHVPFEPESGASQASHGH